MRNKKQVTGSRYTEPAGEDRQYPEDWDVLLTDVFHKSWPLASDPSQQMRLMAMAVDSGGEDGVTRVTRIFIFMTRLVFGGVQRSSLSVI